MFLPAISFSTDWSILYVVIGFFIMFILISAICWGFTCYCRTTKPRTRTKTQKYALLESQNNEAPSCKCLYFEIHPHMYITCSSYSSFSFPVESDTDSDVLFENQNKSNDEHRSNGTVKNGQKLYATTRLGRRIKA